MMPRPRRLRCQRRKKRLGPTRPRHLRGQQVVPEGLRPVRDEPLPRLLQRDHPAAEQAHVRGQQEHAATDDRVLDGDLGAGAHVGAQRGARVELECNEVLRACVSPHRAL